MFNMLPLSAAHQRSFTTLCSFVLLCWIMNAPLLVKGELSCYVGSVNIVNGELSVASTKSVILQQCSSTTTQPPLSTIGITATHQSTKQVTTPQNTTSADSNAATSGDNTTFSSNDTTPVSNTSPPGSNTTSSGSQTSAAGNKTSPTQGSGSTSPTPTLIATGAPLGSTSPGGTPVTADISTNETSTTHPVATSALPVVTITEGNNSPMGCVVTKTNQSESGDDMTAIFSCPAPDSPCKDVGFDGSTGADNQTQCFVGSSSNTIDSFIKRENVTYSTVDSCFVGATGDSWCGNSSNVCLTIVNTIQGDNTTSYYCGNETLQIYCDQDGALREGSFQQKDENITVSCCASTNCNTPTMPFPSTMAPNTSMATNSSTASSASTASLTSLTANASLVTSSSSFPTVISSNTATSPPTGTTAGTPSSTGALKTTSAPSAPAKHSNKVLIIGIVVAFVVGLLGGVIITVIICRRRSASAARPGELLAFDNFHYKRMGADEVNEEVFMT